MLNDREQKGRGMNEKAGETVLEGDVFGKGNAWICKSRNGNPASSSPLTLLQVKPKFSKIVAKG